MLSMLPKFELVPIRQIFHDVAESATPFQNPVMQNAQAGFQQDNVRGIAGDVYCCGDRDAHVGGVERRRIIDAVPHVADDMAAMLQRHDDAVLLRGETRANTVVSFGDVAPGRCHSFFPALIPSTILSRIKSHLPADRAAHQIAVAGNDLYFHSVAREIGNGFRGVRPRWIGEGKKAGQRELVFVGHRVGACVGTLA